MNSVEYLQSIGFELSTLEIKIISHLDSDRFTINLNTEHPEILKAYVLYLISYMKQPTNSNKILHIYSPPNNTIDILKTLIVDLSKKANLHIKKTKPLLFHFGNGCLLRFYKFHRYMSKRLKHNMPDIDLCLAVNIGEENDYAFVDFFKIYLNNFSRPNTRLILSSAPSKKREDLFNRIFFSAELPEGDPNKNTFSPLRIYFWEYMSVDGEWCKNKIREIGEKEFNRKYMLLFITYILNRQRGHSTMRSENKGRPKKKRY